MKINPIYFTREALSSFRRNIVQSIAAITTVALCLVVVGMILLILVVGGELIGKVENKVEIEVFLDGPGAASLTGTNSGGGTDSTTRFAQITAMHKTINGWSEVRRVEYISKEEALEIFKDNFKNNPEVIAQIQDNPLPASFNVSLTNPRQVEQVAKRIEALPDAASLIGDPMQNIKYGQDTVKKLFAVTRWISYAAGGFAILLIFVSLVLITNTIRLAIFARRKEIGIMRLVGASSWFIRWPFILEGMIEGLVGAGIAVLILTALWRTVFASLASGQVLAFLTFDFDDIAFVKLILILTGSGVLIGALGSFIALRRFLKI